jgi:hypothetical protein
MNHSKQIDRAAMERLLQHDPELVLMLNDITKTLEEGDEILLRAAEQFEKNNHPKQEGRSLVKRKERAPEPYRRLIELNEEIDEEETITTVVTYPASVSDEDIRNLFVRPDGYRCECGHCLADRDCCGNYSASRVRIVRDSRIAIARQMAWRNL